MAIGEARQDPPKIRLHDTISTTTSPTRWLSRSGLFAFGFYRAGTGFAVGAWLVASSTVIWTANRDDEPIPEGARLKLTKKGLMLLLRSGDRPVSYLSGDDSTGGWYASMLDSGNFVIYDIDQEVIWQTFDHPTDTIMAGQALLPDHELVSRFSEANHSTGRFRLKMQSDGNLVMFPVDTMDNHGDAYWATNTTSSEFTTELRLDDDGRMYLISDGNHTYDFPINRYSRKRSTIYFARLDPDGIFRSYSQGGNITELPAPFPEVDDRCQIKGTCGLNSYCDSTGDQVECLCLHGFDYIDSNRKFKGCQRNFTGEACQIGKDNITYNISEMENITWQDDWYTPPWEVKSKDECRDACLKDCDCRAALLISGTCSKQKFPFKYGKRSEEPITALLKVGSGSPLAVPDAAVSDATMTKGPTIKTLIVCVAIAACIPMVAAGVGFFLCKNRVARYRKQWQNMEISLSEGMAPRSFSYSELRRATNGFSVQLGKGGFGTVFKGTLSDGETTIAVKKLEKAREENRRSENMTKRGGREFQLEIKVIGKTHHRNLIRLLGFCHEGSNRLLVYEYMSNGSLADLIFDPERWPRWSERVRIASDVAKGILYLHEGCEKPIIHSDIKPENILMDQNGTAKICDFGLANLLMPTQTRSTVTDRRGTPGYVAPEWNGDTPISTKVDVYSFGIVLLELVCCRQIMDTRVDTEEIVLTEWAFKCLRARELEKLLRGDEAEMAELERLVKIGLWCIQPTPDSRPSMKKVMMMLDGYMEASLPPPPNRRN